GEGGATTWQEAVQVEVADGGENGAAADVQSWTIDVTPVNSAPEFTETSPQLVTMSEDGVPQAFSLTLNAVDGDNSGSEMTWSIATPATHGTASVTGSGFGKAIDYMPNADYAGADSFVVEISDGELSAQITVDVTVTPVNDAPQITSIAPTSASNGVLYQYALQVADVDDANDGTALQFSFLEDPAGMTISSTGVIQWTPAGGVTSADVSVQVVDGGEDGAAAAVQSWTIAVSSTNSAPVITQGDSINVLMSEDGVPTPFAVSVDATDADAGTTLTWDLQSAASNGVASASGAGSTPVITYAPTANFSGTDSFVVRVSDGEASDSITINVNVAGVNDAPLITSPAVTTATEGVAYQYSALASDVDGPALAWSLLSAPAGMTIDNSSGVIDWLPGEGGAAPWQEDVTVQVSDGTLTDTQSFTISVTPVNNAPSITSTPSTGATEVVLYSYQVAVNDPDDANNGTDLSFSLTQAPSGMSISATGLVTWTPGNGVSSADVTVQVADGGENGAAPATQSWTITVGGVNDAPVITSAAVTTASEDVAYQYGVTADDIDGDTLSWSLTQAPAGMNIDAATGVISWTPTENGASDWSADVTVQVSDGSLTDTQSFSISVAVINDAPLISSSPSTSGIEGEQYSYQIAVIDPDDSNNGTDISFTLVQGPAGMTISSTGLLTWTPAQG